MSGECGIRACMCDCVRACLFVLCNNLCVVCVTGRRILLHVKAVAGRDGVLESVDHNHPPMLARGVGRQAKAYRRIACRTIFEFNQVLVEEGNDMFVDAAGIGHEEGGCEDEVGR